MQPPASGIQSPAEAAGAGHDAAQPPGNGPQRIVQVITPVPQLDASSDMDVSAEEGEIQTGGDQSAHCRIA